MANLDVSSTRGANDQDFACTRLGFRRLSHAQGNLSIAALHLPSPTSASQSRPSAPTARDRQRWIADLDAGGDVTARALEDLRMILLKGLSAALKHRRDVGPQHIEDFAQEALPRILERRAEFRGNSEFTTWAHVIALRVAFAQLRRKHWHDVSLDYLTEAGAELAQLDTSSVGAIESRDESAHIIRILHLAMKEDLTDRQRQAVAGGLNGLPIDQIATLLRANRGALYKLFHDARKALKARLEREGISAETIRRAFSS